MHMITLFIYYLMVLGAEPRDIELLLRYIPSPLYSLFLRQDPAKLPWPVSKL